MRSPPLGSRSEASRSPSFIIHGHVDRWRSEIKVGVPPKEGRKRYPTSTAPHDRKRPQPPDATPKANAIAGQSPQAVTSLRTDHLL